MIPGPLAPLSLPNLKITPLSYSFNIFIAENRRIRTITTPKTIPIIGPTGISNSFFILYF
jgi:hypothetical protein